jgi:hypothetical protein
MGKAAGAVFFHLSPRAGRGRALSARVRGSLGAFLCLLYSLIDAPHPNPLPVRTGRGGAPNVRR